MTLSPNSPRSPDSQMDLSQMASEGLDLAENEHSRIIGLMQQASQAFRRHAPASEVNAILLSLSGDALSHFREEEKLMGALGYPCMETHKREHEQMEAQIRGLLDVGSKHEALQSAVSVLDLWLDAHLRITDEEFFDFMRRKTEPVLTRS
jgi:hemerythrin